MIMRLYTNTTDTNATTCDACLETKSARRIPVSRQAIELVVKVPL